jgi:hypothetical protein
MIFVVSSVSSNNATMGNGHQKIRVSFKHLSTRGSLLFVTFAFFAVKFLSFVSFASFVVQIPIRCVFRSAAKALLKTVYLPTFPAPAPAILYSIVTPVEKNSAIHRALWRR